MSFSATQAAAEFVTRGAVGVADLYSATRKYNLSDHIRFYNRSNMPLDWILRMKMNNIAVTDPEPRGLYENEEPRHFTPTVNSTDDGSYGESVIWVSDADGRFIQAGNNLICPDVEFAVVSTTNTWTTTKGTYSPETMRVTSVTANADGSNNTAVVVRRGDGKALTTDSPTQITTAMRLVTAGNSIADGGTASTPIAHQPNYEDNYCQIFDVTWSETETVSNTEYYGKMSLAQRGLKKREKLLRDIEAAILFGHKSKSTDANGKTIWNTGGIVEFIPTATTSLDGDSRIFNHGGAFSIQDMRKKMEIASRYGNERKEKLLLIGRKFYTVVINEIESFIRTDMSEMMSKKWGLNVTTVDWGHCLTHMVEEPLLQNMSSASTDYSYDYIGIDLDFVDEMHVQNMDLKIKENVQNNNELSKTNQLYGQLGLSRFHPSAHFRGYGITG